MERPSTSTEHQIGFDPACRYQLQAIAHPNVTHTCVTNQGVPINPHQDCHYEADAQIKEARQRLAPETRECRLCGRDTYRRRRKAFGRWDTVWLHDGGVEDCPPFGDPSPPCPTCTRTDCATTGTPGRWRCWSCETEFRDPPRFDVISDLERRADQRGHHPSTLIATNGTRACCSEPKLAGAMAKAIFAELIADDLNDNVEKRTA